MRILVALSLLAGCAAPPGDELPSSKERKDPKKLLPVFQEFIRSEEWGRAYKCFSPEFRRSVSEEEFRLAITRSGFGIIVRLLTGLEDHGLSGTTLRLCHAEFGISREFKITQEVGSLWTLDFTREDIQYFGAQALEWHRRQTRAAFLIHQI